MKGLAYLRSLSSRFFWRTQTEREMDEELRCHIHLRTNDLKRSGLTRTEAERQAQIEFGSAERFKEECREAIPGKWIDILLQDVRFALRMLRKSPGFTIVVLATIGLGVGATTAIFSLIDAILLQPLPYPHPEELVRIQDDLPGVGSQDVGMSEPEWQDLQHSGIFEYVSPTWYDDNNLTGSLQPTRVGLVIVAPNYFALLGVNAALGRTFPASDHSPGFTGEVVISDGLWKRRFGGDPHIVGKSIRMDTDLYQIVGVMPRGFRDLGQTSRERNIDVWAATSFYGAPLSDHPLRSGRNLPTAIARLKPGVTIATAQTRLDALIASLQKQFPGDYPPQTGWKVRLVPLKESVVGNLRESLMLLLGAVALVLLIGSVNIANLLLARTCARGRELAIRQALGAEQMRLMQQLLTESVLLSLLGGIAGLALLFSAKEFLLQLVPHSLPRFTEVSINWTVLCFAFITSVGSGLIFGFAPALQARRLDLNHMLKEEGRGSTSSLQQARTRRLLVVAEFALSLVLMISAGLLLRSFSDLVHVQLGFNPECVMTIKTRMPYPNDPKVDVYASASQQTPFFREVLRRCRALHGVEQAAFGDLGSLPLGHDRNNQNPPVPMVVEGHQTKSNEAPLVNESIVSPEYFALMGMTLQSGRLFNDFDNDKTEPVAVINEALAQTYWPNENPLGKHVKISRRATSWATIVGIIPNARTESLENPTVPQIYTSLYQKGAKHLTIFLRGHLDPSTVPDDVREIVQAIDPTLPVFGAQALSETVSTSLSQRRFLMQIIAGFAVTALLLASLGIYGVISYMVTERTHEFGIRLALGAQRGRIIATVLRQGLGLAIAGAALGLICALIVSELMADLLYGVQPHDPAVFLVVPLVLFMVAVVASYLPARRAMNVDPVVALRQA